MKALNQYITERFLTGVGDSIRDVVSQYGNDILKILEYGYRDIGGCIGLETKQDLLDECDLIKLYRKNNEIVAVSCYAFKAHPNSSMPYTSNRLRNPGRKMIACAASDGNVHYLESIIRSDFSEANRNVWGEFSGKMATFALRCGALPIPVDVAEKIMSHKHFDIKKEDGYFYTRRIGGKPHTKILMGNHLFYNHNIEDIKAGLTPDKISEFKKLAIKYDQEDRSLHM